MPERVTATTPFHSHQLSMPSLLHPFLNSRSPLALCAAHGLERRSLLRPLLLLVNFRNSFDLTLVKNQSRPALAPLAGR